MARPRKSEAPDLAAPCNLTVGAIERLACPPGKDQAFLRDADGNGLRVRVSPAGAKTFVFEQRLSGKTIRRAIGSVSAWTIEEARAEAKRLSVLLDAGTDPRQLAREQAEAKAAAAAAKAASQAAAAAEHDAQALTVRAVWGRYLAERQPHWGERNYEDHIRAAYAGGDTRKRGKGVRKPGPLAALLSLRLVDLDGAAVERWATREAKDRPARVRLALRQLKAFLRWADAEPDLTGRVNPAAASAKKARAAAGTARPKNDYLQRAQLAAWFAQVRQIQNPVISAYLQTLLLTGARPGEVLSLKWSDIDTQWNGISIRDKVDGERQIPLTPFLGDLLARLPHRSAWVFASSRAVSLDDKNTKRRGRYHAARGTVAPVGDAAQSSASGRLVDPDIAHRRACAAAAIEGLTLHGLRRSFASLTEWLEVPAGVVAQIQGHKPSATAEKHYIRRPLDLLRVHHEKIEAWVLEQAGIAFDAKAAPSVLRVVAAA
jgi:integrase